VQTIYPQRTRMTTGQQRAWDRSWHRWGADVSDLSEGPLDTTRWFGRTAPIVLEIGSGMGEATASMALAAPEVDHLAVEVYQPGLAQLLLRIEQAQITNLRLLRGDAYQLLAEHISEGSLEGMRIYFPDPWPKRRHHKRRLINSAAEFATRPLWRPVTKFEQRARQEGRVVRDLLFTRC
jgi:tRNA (guanine-N7-)-methyltransferase